MRKQKAEQLGEGEVLLLENLRFSKEEEERSRICKGTCIPADVFVSDLSERFTEHASTEGVAHYLPAVCGFLIEKELSVMGGALANPARPFVSILGGKKGRRQDPALSKSARQMRHSAYRRRNELYILQGYGT